LTQTQVPTRPKPRIESLSDLIFGLALSIGAITLIGNVGAIKTPADLIKDIVIFGFNFLILISVWMRYTKTMSALPLENRWTMSLNTALLFTVSIEPFLFNVLELGSIEGFASEVYAGDLGVMMAILAGFNLILADEERKLIPKDLIKEFKIESVIMFIAAAFFLISILVPINYKGPNGVAWRYYLWIIPFAISGIQRRSRSVIDEIRKHQKKTPSPEASDESTMD
jgi:uncharacterized membrane protein